MIYKSFKTQLLVNNEQEANMRQAAGNARFSYNWALDIKKKAFDANTKIPNWMALHKQLVALKATHYPFLYLASKACVQHALFDCDNAFKHFFRKCKKKISGKKGFPKFKSKHKSTPSFRLIGCISAGENYIKLPRLGKIKLHEANYIPTSGKILSATVTSKAGRWFVSVQMEVPAKVVPEPKTHTVIGVDLGIKQLATCSDGSIYANPGSLKKNLRRLKKKQRQLSSKKKGSNNRNKARLRLEKFHYRISNIRKDCLHKITSDIIQKANVIVIEDLAVSNMIKNHSLALAISDLGAYEFRRQIEYKAKWAGREVIIASRTYPSSKLCSVCGWKHDNLTLKHRTFECKICSNSMDRVMNASLNLAKLYTSSSGEINACGDGSSGNLGSLSPSKKQKQESNKKDTINNQV